MVKYDLKKEMRLYYSNHNSWCYNKNTKTGISEIGLRGMQNFSILKSLTVRKNIDSIEPIFHKFMYSKI